ncbi:9185_t:CDS:2 [Rhizophagus irregularis]|nr:9185_t:CDS:2 [Rhizophagus irregularis]
MAVTPVKRKSIEKINLERNLKKMKKEKNNFKADEESFMVSTSISLKYSSISKQRSPNEITDWSCKIISEKDIWSATDTNIFDTLTTLEQPIYFLDGHALKNIVGEPDFVIADNNIKLLIPYLAFKNRYAPFLKKPIMIADKFDEESYSSDKE